MQLIVITITIIIVRATRARAARPRRCCPALTRAALRTRPLRCPWRVITSHV